jgi:hypothetical protein
MGSVETAVRGTELVPKGERDPRREEATATKLVKRAVSFPVLLGMLLVGSVSYALQSFKVDPDVWWHLKTGELILATHTFPLTDSYSWTASGFPWIATEWLGEILWAAVYKFGGLPGLHALHIALGSAIVLSLYAFGSLRAQNCKAGFVATVSLMSLAWVSFSLRPQMIGYLFLIITLIVLERFRRAEYGFVWVLPAIFLLWINIHGSWIIGVGVLALFLVCGLFHRTSGNLETRRWSSDERIRLEVVLVLSLAALTITPYGTELATYPFRYASSLPVNLSAIQEWQPLPFSTFAGKIFLTIVLLILLSQMALRINFQISEALLMAMGIGMACLHRRFLILFVPFTVPFLALLLARWIGGYKQIKDRYVLNFVLLLAICISTLNCIPSKHELEGAVAKRFPVAALEHIRHNSLPGRLFNTYFFGGYMVFSDERTFIDGRGDLFEPTGVLSDYLDIRGLKPGALKLLDSYDVRYCLLQPDEPLVTVLDSSSDWKRDYSDTVSVLFIRKEANHQVTRPAR